MRCILSRTTLTGLVCLACAALPGTAQAPPSPAWRPCTGGLPAPAGLASPAQTRSTVLLTWLPVATRDNCVVSYTVYQDERVAESGLAGTRTTVTGLAPDTVYRFSVAAVNPAGQSARSRTITAHTQPALPEPAAPCRLPPEPPTGLHALDRSSTTVSLAWTAPAAPSGCTLCYEVCQAGIRLLKVAATSATVRGLAPDTGHLFTVVAVDGAGRSAHSLGLAIMTLPERPAAGGPKAVQAEPMAETRQQASPWPRPGQVCGSS